MNSYSVDFEEGEIREYASAPIFSPDWDHRQYARDASRYFDRDDDDDDDSIRSSRPCTPPSQGSMSVPGAPGPKPILSRVVGTTPPSPSPPPQGRWGGVSTTTSSSRSSATVTGAMDASLSVGHDAVGARASARWTIPPDVYRKAESALARITSMSRDRSSAHSSPSSDWGLSSAEGPPTHRHRYSPEQDARPGPTASYSNSYSYASSASLDKHRQPPRSPRKSLLFFFSRASLTCLINIDDNLPFY